MPVLVFGKKKTRKESGIVFCFFQRDRDYSGESYTLIEEGRSATGYHRCRVFISENSYER
jgi:hypothetical protein